MLITLLKLFLIPLLVATLITYVIEYVVEKRYTRMATDISLVIDVAFLAFLLIMYIMGYGFKSFALAFITATAFILMLELLGYEI